jgi:AICAR transformylase/IMP cyclohydrolase PurH
MQPALLFKPWQTPTPNTSENTLVVQDESEEIPVNPSLNTTSTNTLTFGSNQEMNSVAYGNGFHEVPTQYIKQIQSGEFSYLSKLLPKNMSTNNHSDEPMILTLVIKVKKRRDQLLG